MKKFLASARRRLLGLLLVVLIFAFFALTIAFYNKAFTPVVNVTLETGSVGSQMQKMADVKAHGTIVGEVKTIEPRQNGAKLTLALQPEMADKIPADSTALLLPKSLFGEQFVSLQMPTGGDRTPLRNGDEVRQDNSQSAIQIEQALNNLMPVLQAVQPEKLSATLSAVATALQGRGPQIAQTVTDLNSYLRKLNPELPDLTDDLRSLTQVSKTYSDVLPTLTDTLTNLTKTSKTIVDQRANLSNLYNTLTNTSQNLEGFLAANQENLIRVTKSARPTLDLLAKYSPAYPCFLKGITKLIPKADKAFGAGTDKPGLHATIEIVVNRGKYEPGKDTPKYEDTRGPRCYDLKPAPDPFPQTPPDGAFKDGSRHTVDPRSQNDGPLPGSNATGVLTNTSSAPAAQSWLPNSKQEQDFVASLIGPQLGRDPKDVPGWSTLLMGPLMRGEEVDVK